MVTVATAHTVTTFTNANSVTTVVTVTFMTTVTTVTTAAIDYMSLVLLCCSTAFADHFRHVCSFVFNKRRHHGGTMTMACLSGKGQGKNLTPFSHSVLFGS